MYVEGISAEVQASLELVGQTPLAAQFYLAGGTAVALHLGHRRSYDLDFFSLVPFRKDNPRRFLAHLGRLAVEQEDKGTFLGVLNEMYFEDAEADPMPDMLKPVPWPDVRRFFEQEAQDLFRRL